VLTYSVGQQIAVAAWAALLGFVALLVIFRTTNWRDLIRRAGAEAEAHQRAEEAAERSESKEAARQPQRSQPG
jgi:hypothetical protein